MKCRLFILWIFFAGQLQACENETATYGELGVARFEWDRGYPDCTSDCNATDPLASRSLAYLLVVNTTEVPSFNVASTDPAVVEFSIEPSSNHTIHCDAYRPGQSTLVLTDRTTNATIDRLEVKVRDVARISTLQPDLFKERFTIVSGGLKYVFFRLDDVEGNKLYGIGGVDYRLADGIGEEQVELVSASYSPDMTYYYGSYNEMVSVRALSLAEGSLVVEAPSGVSLSIPMSIVDDSVITRISLHAENVHGEVEESVRVRVKAWSGDEPVYSPRCEWSLESDIGMVYLIYEGRDNVQFSRIESTVYVTCMIGPHTAYLEVNMH